MAAGIRSLSHPLGVTTFKEDNPGLSEKGFCMTYTQKDLIETVHWEPDQGEDG